MKKVWFITLFLLLIFVVTPSVLAQDAISQLTETTASTVETTVGETTQTTEVTEVTEATEATQPTNPTIPIKPIVPNGDLSTKEAMKLLASNIYAQSIASSGKTSFNGYCGAWVSRQLYHLRINSWCSSRDGNQHFDYYSKIKRTSGGYYPRAYSVEEYSMLEALSYITDYGKKDVYNIMCGFQWTNTEAGGKYGHVVLIYGIVDGVVYFAESFPIYLKRAHKEGELVTCSVAEFVDYYDGWTEYEGTVVFGGKSYTDSCEFQGTNLIVQARFDSAVRSQPSLLGKNKCKEIRKVSVGERLHVVSLASNADGTDFYQLLEGGFVPATAVAVVRVNSEDLSVEKLSLPTRLAVGQNAEISGKVVAKYASIASVEISVTDLEEQLVLREFLECDSRSVKLANLNEHLNLNYLDAGLYLVKIYADVACPAAPGETFYGRICLGGGPLQVGPAVPTRAFLPLTPYTEQQYEGWVYEDGWYFYENGSAKTGWITHCGAKYYLDETGKAVSGWVTIEDKLYYFTNTGAVVRNSQMSVKRKVYLLDDNGVATKKE